MVRAVTFDFWNTLIQADNPRFRDRRLTAWMGLLAGEGIEIEGHVVQGAIHHAGQRFDEHWRRNQVYGPADAVEDMLDHLGVKVGPGIREGLLASIVHPNPDPADAPSPAPNVGDALEALKQRDIRIGIICDVGLTPSTTLRRYLEIHGLLGFFDHWSFSDEVGTFKPDPAIFDHALAGLGDIAPSEAAHVGDLRRTDVAGAQGKGVFAVRYAGIFDDPGSADDGSDGVDGDVVISDHADLLAVLPLA